MGFAVVFEGMEIRFLTRERGSDEPEEGIGEGGNPRVSPDKRLANRHSMRSFAGESADSFAVHGDGETKTAEANFDFQRSLPPLNGVPSFTVLTRHFP
jgi:hypothetical protein